MIIVAGSTLLASGCVYRMNISQGNYLVSDSVSQLKEGMTRSQVRFLLGTPMVPDAFNDDRWDYYYFYKTRQFKNPVKLRLTVFFEDRAGKQVAAQLGKWEMVSCPPGILHGFENRSEADVYMQTMIGSARPGPVGYADDEIYREESRRLAERASVGAK